MSIHAWQLCSWPPYPWRLPDDCGQWPEFVHVQTTVSDDAMPGRGGLRQGDTVWMAQVGSMIVGVGWEWVELRRGVFMLKDPNYVTTNVKFLDDGLAPQSEMDAIVSANRLAHALPWQEAVTQALAVRNKSEGAPSAAVCNLHPSRLVVLPRPQAPWPVAAAA